MKKNKARKFWHVLIFLAVLAAAIAVVMLLWNALIPSIIGWSAINYWQSAGLIVLSKLLFGGMGHHGHGKGFKHRHSPSHIHEIFNGMTFDEKREYLRRRMQQMPDHHNEFSQRGPCNRQENPGE